MTAPDGEKRALRLALAKGYLSSQQVERALAAAPPGRVLAQLAPLLRPEQVAELRLAYAGEGVGNENATLAAPVRSDETLPPGTPGAAPSVEGLDHATAAAPAEGGDATLLPGTPGAEYQSRGTVADRTPLRADPRQALGRSAALPRAGEVVAGSYEVLRLLGRGGMGAVFLAKDRAGREVALKVQLNSQSERGRFQIEGQSVARLRHPGIVQIHDLGVDEQGRNYCVMGFVPGGSLEDRFQGQALPVREAARIMRDTALALHYAHEQGVLHRDIKPANLLLSPEGVVVVTDFGLAKIVDQSQHLSKTGDLLGTPAFMSPEQARGAVSKIGPAADLYSVGATLYSLLTGRPPFYDMPAIQMLMSVANLPPDPPSKHRPELDAAIDAICMRCLEKAPEDRYEDLNALAADLTAYLDVGASGVRALKQGKQRAARRTLVGLSAVALLVLVAAGLTAWAVKLGTPDEVLSVPSPTPAPSVKAGPSPVRELVAGEPISLQPGEHARFEVQAEHFVVVDLEGPAGAALTLVTPSRRGRVVCEAGLRLPLTLAKRTHFPLESGEHRLELERDAPGPVTLLRRAVAEGEKRPLLERHDRGLGVLPTVQEAFRDPQAQTIAERALARLREDVAKVRRREKPYLVKEVRAELSALSRTSGTPLAQLLIEALGAHVPTDTEPERPAEQVAKRVLQSSPDCFAVRWYCALGRVRAGQPREALPHWRRCKALEPLDPDVRSNLAASLLAARRYAEAEREAEQLLSLNPGSHGGLAFFLLARLWQGKGDVATAWRCGIMAHKIARSRRMLPFLKSLDALMAGGSDRPRGEASLSRELATELAKVYASFNKEMVKKLNRLSIKEPHRWHKLIHVRCTRLVEGREAARALLESYALDLANSPKVKEPYTKLRAELGLP